MVKVESILHTTGQLRRILKIREKNQKAHKLHRTKFRPLRPRTLAGLQETGTLNPYSHEQELGELFTLSIKIRGQWNSEVNRKKSLKTNGLKRRRIQATNLQPIDVVQQRRKRRPSTTATCKSANYPVNTSAQ
jgi:hypothetical protein